MISNNQTFTCRTDYTYVSYFFIIIYKSNLRLNPKWESFMVLESFPILDLHVNYLYYTYK